MDKTQKQLFDAWQDAKKRKAAADEVERQARQMLVMLLFKENAGVRTQYVELDDGQGSRLQYVQDTNYTLANKNDETDDALEAIEALGNRGKFVAERLVKWKPELSVSEYKTLAESDDPTDIAAKRLIDKVLTTKLATPKLEVVGPSKR